MPSASDDSIEQSSLVKIQNHIADEILHSVQRVNKRFFSDDLRLSECYFKREIYVLNSVRLEVEQNQLVGVFE